MKGYIPNALGTAVVGLAEDKGQTLWFGPWDIEAAGRLLNGLHEQIATEKDSRSRDVRREMAAELSAALVVAAEIRERLKRSAA